MSRRIKRKKKSFPIAPEIEIINKDDFSDYMKLIKHDTYTQNKKNCDWCDKKNYLIS